MKNRQRKLTIVLALSVIFFFQGFTSTSAKDLIDEDFTAPQSKKARLHGGQKDAEGWNPVTQDWDSVEYVVLPIVQGQDFDPSKGSISLTVKRIRVGGSQYGHNTLFSFVRDDNFATIAVYLVMDGAKGYLQTNTYHDPNFVWGKRMLPIPGQIQVGKPFTLTFTWGPDPVKDNAVFYEGQKINPSGDGPLTPYLAGVNRVVIGADLGGGHFYPKGDSKAVELKFMKVAITDIPAAVKPEIISITDDTFSVPGISGRLTTGDVVNVQLEAETGGLATFDMGSVTGVPMAEVVSDTTGEGTGIYEGSYTIKPGDDYEDGQIVGRFANAAGVAADPVTSDSRWTIDTGTILTLEVDKNELPADTTSRTRIKVKVADINGTEVEGHHVRVDLATTEEYTGLVGAGDFGENVGAEVEATWRSATDSWGEVEFDYRSGFSAKTVIVTAKDLTTGSVGVDYITSYIDALIDIALTRPVSRAAARRGLLYYMDVEASRTELTADGRSRSVIRAHVYDPSGNPVEGDEITFTLDQDNGTIRTIRAVTDRNGKATAEYRAGKKVGIVQITAENTARGITGYVSITLLSDAPAKIYLAARPDNIPADGFSRADIEVKVTDINENPNEDTEVLFGIVSGSGKLENDVLITDRYGEAADVYTSGKEPGITTVKATVKSKVPTEAELERAKNVIFALYSDLDDEMRLEKWLVRKGDEVKEGDPVCDYSIRGDNFTLTAPYDLRVEELLAESWDYLLVGQSLAVVTPVTIP